MQRFVWDLHYAPPEVRRSYPMTAVLHDTPLSPVGPWVLPGVYTVRLTVNGSVYTQTMTVKMDPRISGALEVLQDQFDLSMTCYNGLLQIAGLRGKITDVRSSIQSILKEGGDKEWKNLLNRAGRKVSALDGSVWTEDVDPLYDAEYAARSSEETLAGMQRKLLLLMGILQGADAKPTSQVAAAVHDQQGHLKELLARWDELRRGTGDIMTINRSLQTKNRSVIRTD
jgi:predicted secreted protein